MNLVKIVQELIVNRTKGFRKTESCSDSISEGPNQWIFVKFEEKKSDTDSGSENVDIWQIFHFNVTYRIPIIFGALFQDFLYFYL